MQEKVGKKRRDMASIQIISKSTVCATSDKQSNLRIELTPWDLRLLLEEYSQKGLLFHKPKPDNQSENTLIQHLKSSLSRTLDLFYPLAGRLATTKHDDNTTSFFIDCNNEGAEFVHAAADGVYVTDIIQPLYVPKIVYSFFPLNGVLNYESTSKTKPLLAIQLTELVDGIFIGISINHTIVDATSFWYFVNSWSEISRGCKCLSKPVPILERWFLRDNDSPIHIPPCTSEQLDYRYVPPPLEQRAFHFSKENIAKLKAKANAEAGTKKISSLQALLSHFCQSLIRNKCIDDPNQEVKFRVLMGLRPRINPPLPPNYFGNASQGGTLTFKARELNEQGLGQIALEINKLIAMHTDEKLKDFLESWTENPKLTTMETMLNHSMVLIGSLWVDVYGNDFGWGRPIAARTGPAGKMDGLITMFPGVEEGSIDFEACLSPHTLEGMGNDAQFMYAVTVGQISEDESMIKRHM